MGDYYNAKTVRTFTRYTTSMMYAPKGTENWTLYDNYARNGNIVGTWRRVGSSVPDWRRKIALGENAGSHFIGQMQNVIDVTDGYLLAYRNDPWYTYRYELRASAHGYDDYYPGHPFSSSDIADLGSQAKARLLRKISGLQTSFQGLVFTGELRETLRMLRSPLKGIINLLDAYFIDVYKRNGRYKKRDRIRRSSELWLEYSFGLSPLVNDLGEALKAYRKLGERDERKKLTAFAADERVDVGGWETTSGVYDVPMMSRTISSWVCKVTERAGLKVYATLPPHKDALTRFGLTTAFIGSALWELTPWSFLFDYFSNIGNIIEAGLTDTSNVLWTCQTVHITGFVGKTTQIDRKAYLINADRWIESETPGHYKLWTKFVERTPGVDLMPSLVLGVPGSPFKWANMAALVASRNRALFSF